MKTYSVDCVRQSSDALDLAANFVVRFEEAGRLHAHADARRGAGGDDGAGLEGHALRKLCNDMVNVEDLQAGVGVLPMQFLRTTAKPRTKPSASPACAVYPSVQYTQEK